MQQQANHDEEEGAPGQGILALAAALADENPIAVADQQQEEEQEELHVQEDGDGNDDAVLEGQRMAITETERSQALGIKDAIEGTPEIDNLPDFWYVQLAIVYGSDIEQAISHAGSMQSHRQEYDIRDSLEDARKTIWDFLHVHENFVLSFTYSPQYQNYIFVVDLATIDKNDLTTPAAWRANLAGMYYIWQALNPDFRSIGNGISTIHECGGIDFFGKFGGIKLPTRVAREVVGEYPTLTHSSKWFHSGMFINTLVGMVKQFMPQDMKNKVQVGCQFGRRLDQFYLIPDAKSALGRNFMRIYQALELRYQNEANFSL